MIDRPNKIQAGGFGKRGSVTINRTAPAASHEVAAKEPAGGGDVPKWAIGAVAGMFLFALVALSGGVGGGGFLGGLLGGMLASKFMNSAKSNPTHASSQAPGAARTTVTAPAADSVTRGGFGTTASSAPHSAVGHSAGG